jgi:hypothetical protein
VSRFGRVALLVTLLSGFLAHNATHADAVSSNVVISAIYGGGGLTGATYTNDYIELYNLSSLPVLVTGWKVQYAQGFDAFADDATLVGLIPAHGYFLVSGASGGTNGSALPTPDATGVSNVLGSIGKARILDLTSNVIDLVGYSGTDAYEGSPALGNLQNDSALARKGGGCVDRDDNSIDFEYFEPNTARNSSVTHTCTPDNPPVLDSIGDKNATTRHELSFTVTGSDPDNDPLTFSASNLPAGANFDDADTHQFTWIPQPGDEGVYHNVHFQVSDGFQTDSEDITITVTTGANSAPVLAAIGNQSTHEGHTLAFGLSATDPDGDPLTFSASNLPGGDIDDETHVFSWTPNAGQAGSYPNVHFEVSDGLLTDSEDITIDVAADQAPTLDPVGNKSTHTGKLLSFTLTGSDPETDPLVFSGTNLPTGASIDPSTGVFSWTPDGTQAGSYPLVHLVVSDGVHSDSEDITITVASDNAPSLDPVGNKATHTGKLLAFTLTGSDPDSDPLSFSGTNLPTGASIDPSTGVFSWTPDGTQAGSYPSVHLVASDGLLSDSEDITIDVAADIAPVLDPIGNKKVRAGHVLTFTVTGSDADADPLTFSATNLPNGATLDPVTGVFRWKPSKRKHGSFGPVTITVSDGLLTASEPITITVKRAR